MKFLSQINVNTEYTLPFVDGNNGQVLTTDGQGAVYWGNVSAGATNLNALTDVEITSPQAGQILNYSVPLGGTVPVWRNITSPYATIASPAFTGIPTAPTAPTGTDSTQIATTAFVKAQGYLSSASSINDLSDVTISTATTGQILQWSGTQWVNATLSTVEYVSKVQHLVKCGVAVTKGQAVYVTTSDGTNMIVGLASNATEPTSSKVIGLAASTGAINDQIFVVTEGLIAGLNTSTANAGDPVWLGTGGNLIFGLLNKPVAPAHLVYLGVVTRVQQNNGEIFVNVQNGFELHELHDVLISSPSAGQLLRRDSDGLWKNWSPNFLTAEADTLQTVTTRGASTSLAISANGVTSPNFTSTALMIINADSSGSLQPDQGSPANKILSFRWQGLEGGYIDTNNVITFAGFKTPTGTASQFLKANGTVDSSTYLTTTTAAATYATFGYVDDEITAVNTYVQDYFVPKTRTLTINGTSYDLSANRSWTITTADSTKVSKSGESHDTVQPNNLGAGDGGFYTVANGYGPSGGNDALIHIPYSNSLWAHQLAFDWALGNDQDMWFRTKNNGTWQGWRKVWHDGNFTDNSANWNTAYNDRITAASVTGTSTKTLTLTQGDGGTVTATWTDYDTDNDAQTLSYDQGAKEITISNGNSITLDGLATEDYVLSQGFTTFQPWNSGTGSINYTAGNVGIGTSDFADISFGSNILKVYGSRATLGLTSTGSLATIALIPNSDPSKGIHLNHSSDGSFRWYQYSVGGETFTLAANGNVGINAGNPTSKLQVGGNIDATGVISQTFWTNDSIRKLNANASLNFRTAAGPIEMVLDGSGNLVVGGISPNASNGAKIFGLKSESGKYFTQNAFGQDGGYTWPSTTYVTSNNNSPVGNTTFRGSGAFQGHVTADYIPIDATKTYKVSVWMRAVSGSPFCYLAHRQYYWDYSPGNPGNGGWGNPYWFSGTPSSSWTEYSMTIGPAGSGADYTHMAGVKFIRHGWLHNYTGDGSATAEFQGWKVEELDSTLASNVTVMGNAVWHAGNDGASSGLDADLLDGQHGSYYQPASTAITTSNIGSQSVSYADYTNRTYRGIIEDTRAAQRTPSGYDDYRVSWEFTDQITGIPDWHTVMTMQGWHDGYAAWQIIGPSSTTAHENWYLRSGNTTTWNTLRRIWHNGDFTSTNISNWNAAYNDRITAVAVSGTGTKTLTLTQQDGGTLTATWTDYDTDNDAQTLSWDQGQTLLSISGGNDITLTGLATEDYVNSQGFVTSSGTVAGVVRTVTGTNSAELVRGNMGDNDQARILVGATASNAGYLEIATADDGTEPIYVRQYTGVFSSLTRTATLLDGSGNTTFPGSLTIGGTFTENSSIRFKENIQPLEPALAKVEQLNPVTYTKIASQEEEIGLIAEEVAELFPEVVTYNEEGAPTGVQYQRLSVILLKAVQELTERVNKLENK